MSRISGKSNELAFFDHRNLISFAFCYFSTSFFHLIQLEVELKGPEVVQNLETSLKPFRKYINPEKN